MAQTAQSFENHAKIVLGYHRITTLLLFSVLIWTVSRLFDELSTGRLFDLLLVLGVIMVGFYARTFATGVQDRVIRLEERLRMQRLFPDDLQGRIGELTTSQLIALRFASDDELEELTRRVLREGISDRKTIKKAIRTWRPDHQRI
jgi:hypothetical protein